MATLANSQNPATVIPSLVSTSTLQVEQLRKSSRPVSLAKRWKHALSCRSVYASTFQQRIGAEELSGAACGDPGISMGSPAADPHPLQPLDSLDSHARHK